MKYLMGLSFFFLFFYSPSFAANMTVSNPPSYELSTVSNDKNDKIIIPYTLKEKGSVLIWLHNEEGKAVYCLSIAELDAGHYQEQVSATHLHRGTYFYSLYVNGKLIDTVKLSI